ncbi:MAG TPA: Si-specific NAD(P)(+) transhydrogenase, partial [Planctomycetota bacterium]|nr:Si-specific NAD(P)(+) transhydrogenase [Planctomycetota bacterium]
GAAQAAYFGKRVALVERKAPELGGAMVNTGTLPSKCLRESAIYLSGLRARRIAGVTFNVIEDVRVEQLMAHKEWVCSTEIARIERNLVRHHIDLIPGTAEFLDPRSVLVKQPDGGEVRLTAPVTLIATGTRPHRPADIPFDLEAIWDSDEILQLEKVPKSMIVVGAGVIGCEYAAMFAAIGVKVTLIEPRERLLPFVDEEVADTLVKTFRQAGIDLRFNTALASCKVEGDVVRAVMKDGSVLEADRLLYAAGRSGNTDGLGLDRIGVKPDKRGQLQVDEHYQTSCPGIYAAGDVIGFPALASTSMDQGRVAMCHAFDLKYKTALARFLPYGIYTIPEVSMVGDTEQDLKKRGEEYEVGRAWYRENARGRIIGDQQGFLKLIFRPADKKLLGIHIVGERAADLVHVGLTVMQFGGTIDTFIDAVYNYPTLGECYKYAAYDGLGRLARRKTFEQVASPAAASK